MSNKKDLSINIATEQYQIDDLDIDSEELVMQLQKLKALRYLSDTTDRKWLAVWTAIVVSIWLFVVLFILIFNEQFNIKLNTTVIVALLGTTTLNVLGLSYIVLKGHFQSTSN